MNAPMTEKKIAAVLAAHKLWLEGKGGERASLVGARLDGARLDGARLDSARLDGAKINNDKTVIGILSRATRSDGFEFFLWHCQEGFFIKAGCRFFDMAQARQHWTATRAGTPLGDETQDILDMFEKAIERQVKS